MGGPDPRSEFDGGRKWQLADTIGAKTNITGPYFVSVGHEVWLPIYLGGLVRSLAQPLGRFLVSLHSHDFFVNLPLFARIQGYRRDESI